MSPLGMPSLIEAPDLRACFAIAQRLGLDFIELNMNLPEYQPDALDADLALRLMDETGLFLTLHLPEQLDPCDVNRAVRGAHLRLALDAIAMAKRLRCPTLNMHMADGVYFTLPDRRVYLFEQYRPDYLRHLRDFRDACADALSGTGARMCVENCGEYKPFQLEGLQMLLESPHFALTFDVGHDCPDHLDEPLILAHRSRLRHMHLHDAAGSRNHLALGDGELDWVRMFRIGEECGCSIVIETKTVAALERSAQAANLRKRAQISAQIAINRP